MNIMKTNMLLLDNKFRKNEVENPTTVSAPVPSATEDANSGMNALMAKGMMNQSNLAFQGGKFKTYAMAGMMALGALTAGTALTSCDDGPNIYNIGEPEKVEININVVVDMSAMQEMLAELKALREDMKNRDAQYANQLQQIINMFQTFMDEYKKDQMDDKAFKELITANQQVIIALLEQQGVKSDRALSILNQILNSNLSMQEKLEAIQGLVSDIKSLVVKGLEYQQKAQEDRAALLAYAEGTYINSNVLVKQGEQSLAADSAMLVKMDQVLQKLDLIDVDMNANSEKLAEQLGIQHAQLVGMLSFMGYTQAQIQKMTTYEIIKAIKENTEVTKSTDAKMAEIVQMLKDGKISAEAAADQIVELLKGIKAGIDQLNTNFLAFVKQYKQDQKQYGRYFRELIRDNKFQSMALANIANTTNIIADDVKNIKGTLEELKALVKNGQEIDYERFEEMFKLLNLHQQASAAEIIAAIERLESNQEAQTSVMLSINDKLDSLKTIRPNDDIIEAINNVTNAVNDGKDDITAELKALQAQLDKLQKTVDAIYDKINTEAAKLNNYFTSYGAKLDAIESKLGNIDSQLAVIIANQRIAQTTLNSILTAVENLKAEIAKLQTLHANGLTKEELHAELEEHIPQITDVLNSIDLKLADIKDLEDLVKSIDKKMDGLETANKTLAEILDKLKTIADNINNGQGGNPVDLSTLEKQLADIYAAIRAIPTSIPNYTEILNKIYDKIGNIKCTCDCQADHDNNEGIIGDIKDIIDGVSG